MGLRRVAVTAVVPLLAMWGAVACESAGDGTGAGTTQPPSTATSTPPDVRPTPAPTPSAAEETPAPAAFTGTVSRIDRQLRERMRHSHRAGCPVPLSDLRYLQLSFVRFDGTTGVGELVVHEDHARRVVDVFRRLYDEAWPIRRMRLVDDYRGDDDVSMAADNTSAYNCRRVAGGTRWSEHAYGRAIDINPVENPYVNGSTVVPVRGLRYAGIDRSSQAEVPRGVIRADDVVVSAFAQIGWRWGGYWTSSSDYQHFSSTGR